MTYSRAEVVEICKPDPNWMNFDKEVEYTLVKEKLGDYLNDYYTVYDDILDFERPTFMDYAEAFLVGSEIDITADKRNKIQDLVDRKYTPENLCIPCFLSQDLRVLLPEEYPDYISLPNDVYVVEDGNHRSVALAIRFLQGEDLLSDVIVTVYRGRVL